MSFDSLKQSSWLQCSGKKKYDVVLVVLVIQNTINSLEKGEPFKSPKNVLLCR